MAKIEISSWTARWILWGCWMLFWGSLLGVSLSSDPSSLGQEVMTAFAAALQILFVAGGILWALWQLNNRFGIIRVRGALF